MPRQAPSFEEIMEETPASRKQQALEKILGRNNQCQIWIGGSENDRFDYPYRLLPVDRVGDRMRNASQQLMIDSSINDPSMTNKEVIEKAIEYDAQYVVPKDYWGDIDKTHESVLEFHSMYHDSRCESTVLFPLQPPHDEHYKRYEDFYSKVSHFAVGGVKNEDPETQIEAVKSVRDVVGPYKHVHGLGMGCSETVIDAICENHNLMDSMDTSTFERLPGFGKIAGSSWEQLGKEEGFEMPNGDEIFSMNAIATEFMVYMANYQLTSLVDRGDPNSIELTEESQMTLGDSWSTTESVETDGGDVDVKPSETPDNEDESTTENTPSTVRAN